MQCLINLRIPFSRSSQPKEVIMDNQNQVKEPQKEVVKSPTPEEIIAENARLKKQTEEYEKRISDKDRHIGQLTNEKTTLEQRITSTQTPTQSVNQGSTPAELEAEAARVMELAQEDPEKAGKELASLLQKTQSSGQKSAMASTMANVENVIKQTNYAEKVRTENKDLMDLGFEGVISARANQLIQQGKPFQEAVDEAVKETREKVSPLLTKSSKGNEEGEGEGEGEGNTSAPSGSQGEGESSSSQSEASGGVGGQVVKEPEPDPTSPAARKARQHAMGIF